MPELSLGNLYRTKADKSHTHEGSEITSTVANATVAETATKLQNSITINGTSFDGSSNITINAIDSSEKGAANGVATLDASGLIPASQLSNGSNSNVNILNSNTNYIADGRKFGMPNGFTLPITEGTEAINGNGISRTDNSITLDARKAALVYDDADGNTSKLNAAYPIDYIDNNTVGFWIFNQPAGSVVPNSAVGKSSIAVSNDLIPSGTLTRVDGRCDYAIKGDGSTGYYTSANYTNFPVGASEREINVLFTCNDISSTTYIASYGVNSVSCAFAVYQNNAKVCCDFQTANINTGYDMEVAKVYLATLQYDGATATCYINGVQIAKLITALSTTASILSLLQSYASSARSTATLHYVELRNKCHKPQEIAEMASKLLFPVCYDKTNATYPILKDSDKALAYHEYKFDETSGTTVADTAGTLDGIAIGTTIIDSDINLGKVRRFSSASDKITLSNLTLSSAYTLIFVGNIKSYSQTDVLFSNRPSTSAGAFLYVHGTTGCLNYAVGGTGVQIGSNAVPLNKNMMIATVIDNTIATVYQDSPINPTISMIPAYVAGNSAVTIGYDFAGYYHNGTIDYLLYIPRALNQAEIAEIYDSLMIASRKSLKSILPTGGISLGYAYAGSNGIQEVNDTDWEYGRREDATDGNRKQFTEWKPWTGSAQFAMQQMSFRNPFVGCNVKLTTFYRRSMSEPPIAIQSYCRAYDANWYTNGSLAYALFDKIYLQYGYFIIHPNIVSGNTYLQQTSGYFAIYVECIEDDAI